jgi:hypothetical protein
MSKEQTHIQELRSNYCKENGLSYLYFQKGHYKDYIEYLEHLLTKEKEQREELIKKTYADALIDLTMFKEGKISKEEMEMIYKRAEQYSNEVIKGRN